MRFLIVGLGSMGKRRIRCLQKLGYDDLYGVDSRADRGREARKKYQVRTVADVGLAIAQYWPDAIIVCVPPAEHHKVTRMAAFDKIPFFVEHSVLDTNMDALKEEVSQAGILAAPSATMLFHPGVQRVKEVVDSGDLGKISNVIYHCGQYLPDWHPYEHVRDFYVSKKETGGAREITAFELTWLTRLFGFPSRVMGNVRKTIEIEGAEEIDDTYNILLDYGDHLGSVTVDVVSRCRQRTLQVSGNNAWLSWNWVDDSVKQWCAGATSWHSIPIMDKGYDPNAGEHMYIEEMRSFIAAVEGKGTFPNTLEQDHRILKLLYLIEESNRTGQSVEVPG